MGLYQIFATDKEFEQEGITLEFGDGIKFFVARAGGSNKRFRKVFLRKYQPIKAAVEKGAISEEASRKVMAEVYAMAVVVGWEGVTDEKGKDLEFNTDNVVKVLSDLPDLFDAIRDASENYENFKVQEIEQEAETLGKSSSGS